VRAYRELLAVLTWTLGVVGCGRFGFSSSTTSDSSGSMVDAETLLTDSGTLMTASCVGLADTCGPSQNESCCGSPLVPGGTFYRSFDVAGDGMFPSNAYPATINVFRLDTYEVTVGRFRKFVEAGLGTQANPPNPGDGAHPLIGSSGWSSSWDQYLDPDTPTMSADLVCDPMKATWTATAGANENLPMNCIMWYEAFAFCAWDGGFLPTEAQWNYAAAGGTAQRAYPWSSPAGSVAIGCNDADYFPSAGSYCVGTTGGLLPVGSTSPQGDGKWGQADLAGSVWEKVLDSYVTPYSFTTCDDCADLSTIAARTVRGGAWNADQDSARTAYRYYDPPNERYMEMGVRCARVP